MSENNIVDMEPGFEGMSAILEKRLFDIITEEFGEMTIAEVVGTLELLKINLSLKLNKSR